MQAGTLFIIFIIIAIIFIILIAIFGYKALYKRRANQALEGVHSTSLIDPLSFFQVIIMIVTLALGIVALSKIEVLSSNILEQTDRIRALNNDIDYLRSNVSSLEELLNNYIESNQLVQNSSYEFGNYDDLTKAVETNFTFTLKEMNASTDVYLVATNINDTSDFTKLLVESDSLTFSGQLMFDIDSAYQITFVLESTSTISGGILFEIDLPDLLGEKTGFSAGVTGLNQTTFDFNFYYNTYGIDNLTIESVHIRYYKNSHMIDSTLDLTSLVEFNESSNKFRLSYESFITDMEITGFDIIVLDSMGETFTSYKIPLGPNGSE